MDAAEQIGDFKRPGDIIVDAGIDSLDAVPWILLSSQHNDGNVVAGGYPNAAAELDSPHGRRSDVQHYEVRLLLFYGTKRPVTIEGEGDVIAFLFQSKFQ